MDLHRTKIHFNLNPPRMNGFEFNMICKKEPVNENHPGALIQDPTFCEIGSRCKDEKEIKVELEDPLKLSRTDIRKEPEEQRFPGIFLNYVNLNVLSFSSKKKHPQRCSFLILQERNPIKCLK